MQLLLDCPDDEGKRSSKTSVTNYQLLVLHIPEDFDHYEEINV
jgi:hypothetical protein